MCNKEKGNCISEILQVILLLQQNACPENCLDTCDRPLLGGGPNCLMCNTRPVMLYTCCGNGTPWSMPISKDNNSCGEVGRSSCVCRVEKIDGNCATFRVLAESNNGDCCVNYIATNSFFTMDLDCCCVIRCLDDTYVDCV